MHQTYFSHITTHLLTLNASGYVVGAVISHIFPDGSQKTKIFDSHRVQIEMEALAIIFAIKKFYKMLYGLWLISYKDKPQCCWIMTCSIKYLSMNSIGLADILSSRLMNLHQNLPVNSAIATVFTAACYFADDLEATALVTLCYWMWFTTTVQNDLTYVWTKIFNLFINRNHYCLLWMAVFFLGKVIVPLPLQNRVLKQFKFGHQSISCMKPLAHSYIYWPNMNKQLEDLASNCTKCQVAAKFPRKLEWFPWPVLDYPWSHLHVDLQDLLMENIFLLLADAYSKWLEIFFMSCIISEENILKLQHISNRFRIPETLVSDNGTAFT